VHENSTEIGLDRVTPFLKRSKLRSYRITVMVTLLLLLILSYRDVLRAIYSSSLPAIDSVVPCTYEQLETTFQNEIPPETNNDCWNLRDRLLHVPSKCIVNKDSMPVVGHGFKGGVHKALVRTTSGYCSAAVKTDHCHSLFSNPFFDRTARSCLASGSYLWNDASYIGGEYTGALVFHVARKLGQPFPRGLLPTWAIVVQDQPLWSWKRRSELQGSPHPDGRILGVLMPWQKLEPIRPQLEQLNVSAAARMLLPAAEGLKFVSQIGLAFQDIIEGNIGFAKAGSDDPHAVLFDNSYLSIQAPCLLPGDSCEFCREDVFSVANYTNHQFSGRDAMQSDVVGFFRALTKMLKRNSLTRGLSNCDTTTKVVNFLHNFQQ
jgi:hypothetical protein